MILVTGANSFLGTNVVAALLDRGMCVRSLVRSANPIVEKTEVFRGNVNDIADIGRAMEGCSVVIHIAANTSQDLLRFDDYAFNWECGEKIARVALAQNIERLIFISSANTIGSGTPRNPANESNEWTKPYTESLYARSKRRAEEVVLSIFPRTIIINPGFMLGAYDAKPSSGEIIARTVGRRVIFAPKGGKSFVNVCDVAQAVANALIMGRFGERYLATGISLSFKDFYRKLGAINGTKFHVVTIASPILVAIGYVGDLMRVMGIKTALSSINMRMLCQYEYYDNSKIVNELQMRQSAIDEAIKDFLHFRDSEFCG